MKPYRNKFSRIDLIICALGLLVIWRVDWGNMNSFHYLIMFMFFLCLMLRWANMRKVEEKRRKQAEYMAQKAARENGTPVQPSGERKPVIVFADAAEVTEAPAVETPAEATPVEDAPAEEKTEA